MAATTKFYWYKVQLVLAAVLQAMSIFVPLSYAGNWENHTTAFLHPLWISSETNDFATRTVTTDTDWFFQRPELIVLVIWMGALTFLMGWVIFSKVSWARRVDRLGKAMGGFAAQILLAYLVAQSASWHVGEVTTGSPIEVRTQPEFFLLLFPLVLSFMAWRRMKAIPIEVEN